MLLPSCKFFTFTIYLTTINALPYPEEDKTFNLKLGFDLTHGENGAPSLRIREFEDPKDINLRADSDSTPEKHHKADDKKHATKDKGKESKHEKHEKNEKHEKHEKHSKVEATTHTTTTTKAHKKLIGRQGPESNSEDKDISGQNDNNQKALSDESKSAAVEKVKPDVSKESSEPNNSDEYDSGKDKGPSTRGIESGDAEKRPGRGGDDDDDDRRRRSKRSAGKFNSLKKKFKKAGKAYKKTNLYKSY